MDYNKGDYFGEVSIIKKETRKANVIAMVKN